MIRRNKKKIIIGSSILVTLLAILLVSITLIPKDNEPSGEVVAKNDYRESPYTLDEFYKKIENNELYTCNFYEEECQDLARMVLHFYEYFTKDTMFIGASKKNTKLFQPPLEYKYVTYDEYFSNQEFVEYASVAEEKGVYGTVLTYARLHLENFANE